MSFLTLILSVALAVCAVVAAWNSLQLVVMKVDSRSNRLRSLAKVVACVGGVLIVIPLVGGFGGWVLKLFIGGGVISLLCYLFLIYKASASSTERRDE
jgi:hypothetical protein